MALRSLIVDDNAHFLAVASDLLEREGVTVVGVASTSAEAMVRVAELRPDVTLVDVDLGEESGLDLARRLTDPAASTRSRVIVISAYPEQDVAELIDASVAIGFLAKARLSGQAVVELLREADRAAG